MAYLYRRKDGRTEIREAHSTRRGPRSHTLVSFRGALRRDHLDRAEANARRPFDRAALLRRARELGVAVVDPGADTAARELLAHLRRDASLDPRLAALLREALAARPADPLPHDLAEAAEWIGTSDHERGRALRDVLRLYDVIARSRDPVREAHAPRFPRFASRPGRAAS
ncbi:MAG: hypothetical protein E6J87_06960 [Deltaproteobacteria bacterium]|nr:MAG: hypothetical protein E6J87_06960 [Deltaproteobacteria bacterium]